MEERKLNILWTNADPDTAIHMVMMYAKNSLLHGWWDKVTVIVWGASARLIAESEDVREHIKIAMHAGVEFSSCLSCAANLGVVEDLEKLGIEVKRWGEPLAQIIQSGEKLITV